MMTRTGFRLDLRYCTLRLAGSKLTLQLLNLPFHFRMTAALSHPLEIGIDFAYQF